MAGADRAYLDELWGRLRVFSRRSRGDPGRRSTARSNGSPPLARSGRQPASGPAFSARTSRWQLGLPGQPGAVSRARPGEPPRAVASSRLRDYARTVGDPDLYDQFRERFESYRCPITSCASAPSRRRCPITSCASASSHTGAAVSAPVRNWRVPGLASARARRCRSGGSCATCSSIGLVHAAVLVTVYFLLLLGRRALHQLRHRAARRGLRQLRGPARLAAAHGLRHQGRDRLRGRPERPAADAALPVARRSWTECYLTCALWVEDVQFYFARSAARRRHRPGGRRLGVRAEQRRAANRRCSHRRRRSPRRSSACASRNGSRPAAVGHGRGPAAAVRARHPGRRPRTSPRRPRAHGIPRRPHRDRWPRSDSAAAATVPIRDRRAWFRAPRPSSGRA